MLGFGFAQDLDTLPALRSDSDTTAILPEGEPFFQYRYDLDQLKSEIDSLKQVLKVYEKRKTIPEIDPRLLELIQRPELQHRIILNNGTVIMGEIISKTDQEIIVRTQLGKLVIDAKHVVNVEEDAVLSAKIEWIGEPSIEAYPTKEIISGRVKNNGQTRADFARVIAHLWTSTTEEVGIDSAFIDGKEFKYDSGVISDTMLEPGQSATIQITIKVPDQKLVSYRTYDILWTETK